MAGKKGAVSLAKEFKDFVTQGNIVDLAVAVVMATAFTAVIKAFVENFVTPLIAAIFGKPNFGNLYFTIHHSQFFYGQIINAIITFLGVAAVLFFVLVKPLLMMRARLQRDVPATEAPCPACLTKIPVAARRCASCTEVLADGWSSVN